MLPMRPWRQLLKHASGKQRQGTYTNKTAKMSPMPRRLEAEPSRTPLKNRIDGETRQDCDYDHEGGVLGDHGGRLLQTPRGPGRSGVDSTRERETHCCPRSECRSVGRHWFACHSRNARDTGGSLVGREHERVCRRVTGHCATAGQRLDDTVDRRPKYRQPSRYRDGRLCHQSAMFLEREAGAVAFASRAQKTSRERGLPRMRSGRMTQC